jgi:chromate transporter
MMHSAFSVFKTFLKLGLTSFGGPIAHIGYFRKELVDKQKWVSEQQFSQLLAICQFLPGPASSQLGFALGLLRAGWLGAMAAFTAFTLPSALLLVAFASTLPLLSNPMGEAIIHGLKLVAVAVVTDAVITMFKKLCPDTKRRIIAVLATALLINLHFAWMHLLVIVLGGFVGLLIGKSSAHTPNIRIPVHYSHQLGLMVLSLFLVLLLFSYTSFFHNGLITTAQTFYQAGAFVFGGGHVVLPLLENSVVNNGLISNEQFIAGYGASQAIPGPMFSFSAYLGAIIPASQQVSYLSAAIALISIFLPGFLLIITALPMWKSIAQYPKSAHAIAGINAVVVGILAATLYHPVFTSSVLNQVDFLIGFVGIIILVLWKRSPLLVVAWCVLASLFSMRFI